MVFKPRRPTCVSTEYNWTLFGVDDFNIFFLQNCDENCRFERVSSTSSHHVAVDLSELSFWHVRSQWSFLLVHGLPCVSQLHRPISILYTGRKYGTDRTDRDFRFIWSCSVSVPPDISSITSQQVEAGTSKYPFGKPPSSLMAWETTSSSFCR